MQDWKPRSRKEHVKYADLSKKAKTITEKNNIEKQHGYRYTELLRLHYFEPSTFCVIDPMHNLFLGTAKKMFGFWIDSDKLSKSDLNKIGERISVLNIASDVGRIPSSISVYCINNVVVTSDSETKILPV